MNKENALRRMMELDLHLFDGGEGGGAADGGGEGAPAAAEGEAAAAPVYTPKRGKANPLKDVVYGKQAGDVQEEQPAKETETQVVASTDAEKRAAYDAFMADPYNRNLYDQNVQAQISRRFKNHGDMEAELNETRELLELQREKYGVKTNAELRAAIEADESFFEDAANEAGMTVEQYKRTRDLERQVRQYEEEKAAVQRQQQMQQDVQRWVQQAEEVKQRFPGFDLQAELTHPETGERFASLLRSGQIDVGTAYQVIHMDDLMTGAIGHAVRTAQQQTVNNIRARGMRPAENGAGGRAPATVVKKDPSKFTKADRAEIGRRVERGETIEL